MSEVLEVRRPTNRANRRFAMVTIDRMGISIYLVIPAPLNGFPAVNAESKFRKDMSCNDTWIPAFARMTRFEGK